MENCIEPATNLNGNSETPPSAKVVRTSGAKRCCSSKDKESSEQKKIIENGCYHTGLQNRKESFNENDTENAEKTEALDMQTTNDSLQQDELNIKLQGEAEENSYTNTKFTNGMAELTIHQLQDLVLDNKMENQNQLRETEIKLQHSKERMDSGFHCDVNASERRKPKAMMLRNSGSPRSDRRNDNTCSTEKEFGSDFEIQSIGKELQDATPMKDTQDDMPTITGKLENTSHGRETSEYSLRKRIQELEMEVYCITEQCKKEKSEIQQKYDEAFLKLVGDNRRMNENLKEIQVHVRREKIESERTKNEVELVLQERQKLVDQITELSKSFESMIGERDRMESVIETSISAFDSKLCAKDAEIRDLQETIDNDRKQFMEERDEYLTVIESLKAQLQLQEEHLRWCKAI